jgi:hypothetical protein
MLTRSERCQLLCPLAFISDVRGRLSWQSRTHPCHPDQNIFTKTSLLHTFSYLCLQILVSQLNFGPKQHTHTMDTSVSSDGYSGDYPGCRTTYGTRHNCLQLKQHRSTAAGCAPTIPGKVHYHKNNT